MSDPPEPERRAQALPKRFRRNVLSTYANTVVVAVVTLVMTPVLANGLGTEAYGIWVLVGSLALYLELLEFGFGKAALKYVAEFDAVGDRRRLLAAIATSFWLLALPGLAAMVIGVGIALVFPDLFGVSGDLATASQILVVIVVLDLALSIPGDTFGGALVGLQRFDLLNATLIAISLSQAVAWAIVIAAGGGLVPLGIVTVALSLVGQLLRFLVVRRLIPEVSVSPRRFDRDLVRRLAGLSGWLAISDVALIVKDRVDVLIVGLVVGVSGAGIYGVAQKLTRAVWQLITPAVRPFFPHSSGLAAAATPADLRHSFLVATRLTLGIAAPLCLTLAVLSGKLLEAWIGPEFESGGPVVTYLAAAIAATMLSHPGLVMLQGTGRARGPSLLIGAEAALNLALSVVLGNLLGIEGVALATLIAAATLSTVAVPFLCRRYGVPLAAFLAGIVRAHGPAAAVALLVARLVVPGLSPSLLPVIGAGLLICACYLVVLAVTGLSGPERRAVLNRLARRRLLAPAPPA